MEIKIKMSKAKNGVDVFETYFIGSFDIEEYKRATAEFAESVQQLRGKPFRVLVDFTQSRIMTTDEYQTFMDAQTLAIDLGMERDVVVSQDIMIDIQLKRLSKEGKREKALGELMIFKTIEEGLDYIKE